MKKANRRAKETAGAPSEAAGAQGFPTLDAAFAGGRTAASGEKTVSAILGEIVWLMSQSPQHRMFMIQNLEARVMPAVLLRQFRLYDEKDTPIGAVLYARVGAEAAARLDAGAPTLRPQDWRSGESVRIVDLIAPFGGKEEMEREFGEMVK